MLKRLEEWEKSGDRSRLSPAGKGIVVFVESGGILPFLSDDSPLMTAVILRDEPAMTVRQIPAVSIVTTIAGDQAGF